MTFDENKWLEISDNLDDDGTSFFLGDNRNAHTKKQTKTDLNALEHWSLAE